jgi:hypothetical protein
MLMRFCCGFPELVMRTKSQTCIRIVIVIVCCWAARTRSEDNTEALPGTRSLTATPFQLILPRDHLLGDWFGTRVWLEDHGITPVLTFVSDALGNPTGGMEQGFTAANNLDLEVNFDLKKLAGIKGGSFLISTSYRFGSSLSAEYIGNAFTVQQVFGGETFQTTCKPICYHRPVRRSVSYRLPKAVLVSATNRRTKSGFPHQSPPASADVRESQ